MGTGDGEAHGHGLSSGGAFIEERGTGEGEACEVGDHGLEVEERFEAALADLGLIGGVLGVPTGIFEDVAEDDRGRDGVGIAHADVGAHDAVLRCDALEAIERGELAVGAVVETFEFKWASEADGGGNGGGDEGVHGSRADEGEHVVEFMFARAEVSWREGVAGAECGWRDGVLAGWLGGAS